MRAAFLAAAMRAFAPFGLFYAGYSVASRHARNTGMHTPFASESLNVFDPDMLSPHQKWTSVRRPRTQALSVFTPATL